jgi:hypothetical protein
LQKLIAFMQGTSSNIIAIMQLMPTLLTSSSRQAKHYQSVKFFKGCSKMVGCKARDVMRNP